MYYFVGFQLSEIGLVACGLGIMTLVMIVQFFLLRRLMWNHFGKVWWIEPSIYLGMSTFYIGGFVMVVRWGLGPSLFITSLYSYVAWVFWQQIPDVIKAWKILMKFVEHQGWKQWRLPSWQLPALTVPIRRAHHRMGLTDSGAILQSWTSPFDRVFRLIAWTVLGLIVLNAIRRRA